MIAAAAIGWGELACASRPAHKKRTGRGGHRRVPQATIDALREDAKTMPLAQAAAKHGVSRTYAYQVVEMGLRSRERERLR